MCICRLRLLFVSRIHCLLLWLVQGRAWQFHWPLFLGGSDRLLSRRMPIKGRVPPFPVMVHSTRAGSASWAFQHQASVSQVSKAATWSSVHIHQILQGGCCRIFRYVLRPQSFADGRLRCFGSPYGGLWVEVILFFPWFMFPPLVVALLWDIPKVKIRSAVSINERKRKLDFFLLAVKSLSLSSLIIKILFIYMIHNTLTFIQHTIPLLQPKIQ